MICVPVPHMDPRVIFCCSVSNRQRKENPRRSAEGGVVHLEVWGAVVGSVCSNDAGRVCHFVTGDI